MMKMYKNRRTNERKKSQLVVNNVIFFSRDIIMCWWQNETKRKKKKIADDYDDDYLSIYWSTIGHHHPTNKQKKNKRYWVKLATTKSFVCLIDTIRWNLKFLFKNLNFFFCCSDDFQCYVYMCLLYYYHSGFVYTQNNEDKTRQIKSPRSTNFEEKKENIYTHTHMFMFCIKVVR